MGSSHKVDAHRFADDDARAADEELNEIARENWGDPEWMAEAAAVISEEIYLGFDHENLLQLLTVLQNVGKFDRVTVKETRGLRAFWVARGGYIKASSMRSDVTELEKSIVGFHVTDEVEKFQANFAETQRDLIDLGVKRMDATVNQYLFALFQEAVPSGSAQYASASGLSLATLDAALAGVYDQTEDGNVSIIARRPMLDQINTALMNVNTGNSLFIPETNQQIIDTGVLGRYRGALIVHLKNYKDDLEIPFLPANELWVVGRDASKAAFFGGLESKEFEEEDAWYWHYLAKREFGCLVHHPNRLFRIVDTHINPTQGSGGSYAAA